MQADKDCATQPDEKSDPFLLRRLEDRLRDGGGERRFGGLQGLGVLRVLGFRVSGVRERV